MENIGKEAADILDLRVLGEVCAEPGKLDDPVLARLIALFFHEELGRMAELARLTGERNRLELARAAHKLAGSCAVIGGRQVHEEARRLEIAAGAAEWSKIEDHLSRVQQAWTRLQAALASHQLVPGRDLP